jgi:hypothetical protein
MTSRGRDYDRGVKQRSRSRTDAFLDALEGGHVREAFGALKPSLTPKPSSRSQNHRHHHHHPNNRGYDYYDEGPPRHSRYDDYYSNRDNYYYPSEQQRHGQGANAAYYRNHPAAPAAAVGPSHRRHRSTHSQPYSHSHYYYSDDHDHDRPSHSHTHHHSRSHNRSNQSRRRASSTGPDFRKAASAAVTAGLLEAWRSRHDAENRGRRVATAAIGAAATDSALEGRREDRGKKGGKKRTVLESAFAGLVENRVLNGPRR